MSASHPSTCLYDTLAPVGRTLAGWSQERCGALPPLPLDSVDYTAAIDAWVFQAGAHFDLTLLDQIPAKTITSARLTFDEVKFRWTDADGNDRDVRGCISTIGLPNTDWLALAPNTLIPNTTVVDFSPWPSDRQDFSGTEFDVTAALQSMQALHGDQRFAVVQRDQSPVFPDSFVLRGSNENQRGDDQSSCLSAVNNVQLHVTFVVPDR